MNQLSARAIVLLAMGLVVASLTHAQSSATARYAAEEFAFHHEGLRYQALAQYPGAEPSALVLVVPGHGCTDLVDGDQLSDLRTFFLEQGLTVVVWDRAGCGRSEGTYNHDQPVADSAAEAAAAIAAVRERKIAGSATVGIWSLSRGGWIAPLTIDADPSIAFWISVSGPDQLGTFRYLLETNFALVGRSPREVERLMAQYDYGWRAIRGTTSYEGFLAGTETLGADPWFQEVGPPTPTKEEYEAAQQYFRSGAVPFDEATGLEIMIPDFDALLRSLEIPVLALFGELDSQVDWRRTRALYESTLGQNPAAALTIHTFPDCNHLMYRCETGAYRENLAPFGWERCAGYFDTMGQWLQSRGLASP